MNFAFSYKLFFDVPFKYSLVMSARSALTDAEYKAERARFAGVLSAFQKQVSANPAITENKRPTQTRSDTLNCFGDSSSPGFGFSNNLADAFGSQEYTATKNLTYSASDAPEILNKCICFMLPHYALNDKADRDNVIAVRSSDVLGFDGLGLATALEMMVLPAQFIAQCDEDFRRDLVLGKDSMSGFSYFLKIQALAGFHEKNLQTLTSANAYYPFLKVELEDISKELRYELKQQVVNTIRTAKLERSRKTAAKILTQIDLVESKQMTEMIKAKQFTDVVRDYFRWNVSELFLTDFQGWAPEFKRVNPGGSLALKHARCEVLASAFAPANQNLLPVRVFAEILANVAQFYANGSGNRNEVRSNLVLLTRVALENSTDIKLTKDGSKKGDAKIKSVYQAVRAEKGGYFRARQAFYRLWCKRHNAPLETPAKRAETGLTFVQYMRYTNGAKGLPDMPNEGAMGIDKIIGNMMFTSGSNRHFLFYPYSIASEPPITAVRDGSTLDPKAILSWQFAQFVWTMMDNASATVYEGSRDTRYLLDFITRLIDSVWPTEIDDEKEAKRIRKTKINVIGPVVMMVCMIGKVTQTMAMYALWVRFAFYLKTWKGGKLDINQTMYPHEQYDAFITREDEGEDTDEDTVSALGQWRLDCDITRNMVASAMAGVIRKGPSYAELLTECTQGSIHVKARCAEYVGDADTRVAGYSAISYIGLVKYDSKEIKATLERMKFFLSTYKVERQETKKPGEVKSSAPPAEGRKIIGTIQEKSTGIVAQIFPTDDPRKWIYPDGTTRYTFAVPKETLPVMSLDLNKAITDADYALRCFVPAPITEYYNPDPDDTRTAIATEEEQVAKELLDKAYQASKRDTEAPEYAIAFNAEVKIRKTKNLKPSKSSEFRFHPDRVYWDVFFPDDPNFEWKAMVDRQNPLEIVSTLSRHPHNMQITFHMVNEGGDAFTIQSADVLSRLQGLIWAKFEPDKTAPTARESKAEDTKTKQIITEATTSTSTVLRNRDYKRLSDLIELAAFADRMNTWRIHNYRLVKSAFFYSIELERKITNATTDLPTLAWSIPKEGTVNKQVARKAKQGSPIEAFMRTVADSDDDLFGLPLVTSVGEFLDQVNDQTFIRESYDANEFGRDFRQTLSESETAYYHMKMRRLTTRVFPGGFSSPVSDEWKALSDFMQPFKIDGDKRVNALLVNTSIKARTAPAEDAPVPELKLLEGKKSVELSTTNKSTERKVKNLNELIIPKIDNIVDYLFISRVLIETCNLLFTHINMRQVIRDVDGKQELSSDEDLNPDPSQNLVVFTAAFHARAGYLAARAGVKLSEADQLGAVKVAGTLMYPLVIARNRQEIKPVNLGSEARLSTVLGFFNAFGKLYVEGKFLYSSERDDLANKEEEVSDEAAAVRLSKLIEDTRNELSGAESADVKQRLLEEAGTTEEKRYNAHDSAIKQDLVDCDNRSPLEALQLLTPITDEKGIMWPLTVGFWKSAGEDPEVATINSASKKAVKLYAPFSTPPDDISLSLLGDARNVFTCKQDTSTVIGAIKALLNKQDDIKEQQRYESVYNNVRHSVLNSHRQFNYLVDCFEKKLEPVKVSNLKVTVRVEEDIEPKGAEAKKTDAKRAERKTATAKDEFFAIQTRIRNRSRRQRLAAEGSTGDEESEAVNFAGSMFNLDIRDGKGRANAAYNIITAMYDKWKPITVFEGVDNIDLKSKNDNNEILIQIRDMVWRGWSDQKANQSTRVPILRDIAKLVLEHSKKFFNVWVIPAIGRRFTTEGGADQKSKFIQNDNTRLEDVIEKYGGVNALNPAARDAIDGVKNDMHMAARIPLRLEADINNATFGLSNLLAYLAEVYDGFEVISPNLAESEKAQDISEQPNPIEEESDSEAESDEETEEETEQRLLEQSDEAALRESEFRVLAEEKVDNPGNWLKNDSWVRELKLRETMTPLQVKIRSDRIDALVKEIKRERQAEKLGEKSGLSTDD